MFEQYTTLIGIGVQTIIFLLGGYAMVLRNDWSNKALKDEVKGMQEEIQKLSQVVVQMAVQTVRIDNLTQHFSVLQRTVEDLRRGNGFVRGRTGVDGEYP